MGSGLVSNVVYFMFLLIMLFLVVTNYKGMTAVMKQGGTSTVSLVKALQGR
jgi:DNA-binding phage protein